MKGIGRILLMPRLTAVAAVFYAFATLFEWVLAHDAGMPHDELASRSAPGLIVLCAAAALYGLGRVVAYHPACRRSYWKWLETAPWRPGMALPLGPVTLNWRDALVLVPMALLARDVSGGAPVAPLLAFGIAHLVALLMTGLGPGWAYALLIGFAGLVRLSDDPYAVAAALVPMYGVALGGLRHGFPKLVPPAADDRPTPKGLGAPFEQLAPVRPRKAVPPRRAVAGAVLGGWTVYCLIWRVATPLWTPRDVFTIVALMGVFVALTRFSTYRGGSAPPLSLAGRWRTGRWIIRGYDAVYFTTLLTLLVSFASAAALIGAGASAGVAAGLSVGVTLLAALVLPPTLARWQLTAERRIERTASEKFIKLA